MPSSSTKGLNAVVLAAGKGTRMNSADLPKVLFPLNGKPMLAYVLEKLKQSGVARPIVIVGFLAEKVRLAFGDQCAYAEQIEQNGTATAVLAARQLLEGQEGVTVIASGDQPFISADSIGRLIGAVESGATLAVLAGRFESKEFDAFGRVIARDGRVEKIIEAKNATAEELKTRLFNLGTYAADNSWLWPALAQIKRNELTREYYLTDLVEIAVSSGKNVVVVEIADEQEAIGINTPAQLALAQKRLRQY